MNLIDQLDLQEIASVLPYSEANLKKRPPNVGPDFDANLSLDNLDIPDTLVVPMLEKKLHEGPEPSLTSDKSRSKSRYMDSEQVSALESCLVELEYLINSTANRLNSSKTKDEDLITLITLENIVREYSSYQGDSSLSTPLSRLLWSKIAIKDMMLLLCSLKFKDKNLDMIIVHIKQYNDVLLELLINPGQFHKSHINFYKVGKSIMYMHIFLLKNLFQEFRFLVLPFREASTACLESSFLFSPENLGLLREIVLCCLNIYILEESKEAGEKPSAAFQQHSVKLHQLMSKEHSEANNKGFRSLKNSEAFSGRQIDDNISTDC